MLKLWLSCRNAVDFWLRNRLKFRRPGYQEPHDKRRDDWGEREAHLSKVYALKDFREKVGDARYGETLTRLEELESLLAGAGELLGEPLTWPGPTLSWLDVGAKNWAYVQALWSMLCTQTGINQPLKGFTLHGIELDGYRLYTDGHSRADYAQVYVDTLKQTGLSALPEIVMMDVDYRVGDVRAIHRTYDIVTCFLPFVLEMPLLKWGLPRRYFSPEAFLVHLIQRVSPGGVLLLVNQGEAEAQEQEKLLNKVAQTLPGLRWETVGILPNAFDTYAKPHYGWVVLPPDRLLSPPSPSE